MGDRLLRRLNYPAAERNKTFILEVLLKHIPTGTPAKLLEIASGTGQHAAYFASNMPQVTVQPTEVDSGLFESISGYAQQVKGGNLKEPILVDVEQGPWPIKKDYDYILNVNMFHVAPYSCAKAFFKYGSQVLRDGGLIFTYGPYAKDGVIEPQSNVNFDRSLRSQNGEWGLRDIRDLKVEASKYGVLLRQIYDLPANNKCLVWQKTKE